MKDHLEMEMVERLGGGGEKAHVLFCITFNRLDFEDINPLIWGCLNNLCYCLKKILKCCLFFVLNFCYHIIYMRKSPKQF